MCDCEPCMRWQKEARGYIGSTKCKNITHCICCSGNQCVGCNHSNVAQDDYESIHFHANIGYKEKHEYSLSDWVIVHKMESLLLKEH